MKLMNETLRRTLRLSPGSSLRRLFITGHAMREEELARILRRWAPSLVTGAHSELAASGRAQVISRFGH